MTIDAVIPARGGSKRLPGKNIKPLAGKPLIAHTIAAALAAEGLRRVIVSTDDPAIAEAAREAGAEVPFLRPAALAGDLSPAVGVLQHALDWLAANGGAPTALALLQPTSPLRTGRHVEEAIALFRESGADTVTAVREARDHPWWAWTRDEAGFHPFFSAAEMSKGRHELPPAFAENGAIFIVSAATLRRGTLYGVRVEPYPMPEAVSLDIDTAEDFALAEYLLGRTR